MLHIMMSTCTKTSMKPYEFVIFQVFKPIPLQNTQTYVMGVGAYTNHVDVFLDPLTMTPS